MTKPSLSAALYRFKGEWNLYLADSLEAELRGEKENLPVWNSASREILGHWDRPAESFDEAMMALELAAEDYELGDTPCIPAMINAALGWFYCEQKRRAGE